MLVITRRDFFRKTSAGAVALAALKAQIAPLKANPLGMPIGSQTYPFRDKIEAGGFAQLMKDMKAIGIDQVEVCDPWNYANQGFAPLLDGKTTRKMLDDAGMKAISCHVALSVYRTRHQEALNWAHELGLTQLSTSDLGGVTKDGKSRLSNGLTTEYWIKEAADEYNQIAKVTKAAGMITVLHNEGFCSSRTVDGRLTYPLLIEALDPALVGMQFQMSSMTTMGNPVTYFTVYPGRIWSAHLQGVDASQTVRGAALPTLPDKNARGGRGGGRAAAPRAGGASPAAGAGAGNNAGAPTTRAGAAAPAGGGRGGLSVGEDSVDWPAVFAAAKIGGLKNFFIEQPWDLTVKSAAYLKTLS